MSLPPKATPCPPTHTCTYTHTQLDAQLNAQPDDGLSSSPAKFECRSHSGDGLPKHSLVADAGFVGARQAVAHQPKNEAARTTRLPAEFAGNTHVQSFTSHGQAADSRISLLEPAVPARLPGG